MRWRVAALGLSLVAGLLGVVAAAVPAEAAESRCAAYDEVRRETAPGGAFAGLAPVLVASYNIGGYNAGGNLAPWDSRAGRIVEMIQRCHPDVIGLQEASEAWMQRRPFGQRNYAQFEHVVDLMNDTVDGSPYRVTNAYRESCPTIGRNPAVWNGTWRGQRAPWRACATNAGLSASDNRIVYDTRTLTFIDQGVTRLASATSNQRTLAWAIFEVRESGRRFVFANTHLEAKYRGRAVGSSASNAFRRREARTVMASLSQVRQGLPVVLVGDLNSHGRYRGRTAVDDLTRAGYTDVLGTDRRLSKSRRYRGSCHSVGVTRSLTAPNRLVPLDPLRRVNVAYNSSSRADGGKIGRGKNICMFRTSTSRRTRPPATYYRYQGVRIDYILATAPVFARGWETVVDANLRRARYLRTPPSDHNMVAATLAF